MTPRTRRSFILTTSIAPFAVGDARASVPPPAPPYDWQRLVGELVFPTGKYQGALLQAPFGKISWYFGNVGLLHFVPDRPDWALGHLGAYLRNMDPNTFTIDDWDPFHEVSLVSDADDSSAATFLSLAVAYTRTSGDTAWWQQNSTKIRSIASANLLDGNERDGKDFTRARRRFRGAASSDVAYLMDQCEVYRGLADYAEYLVSLRDPFADVVMAEVVRLGRRIHEVFFDDVRQCWLWSDVESSSFLPTLWYPDIRAQIYPHLFNVRSTDLRGDTGRFDRGYQLVLEKFPNWAGNPPGGPNDFPNAEIGYYVALRRRDFQSALRFWSSAYAMYLPGSKNAGHMLVSDLGYMQSILRIAAPRP